MIEAPCERQAMHTTLHHHATLHHAVAARRQTRRRAVDPRPGTAAAMAGETHGVICCCMISRLCCSRPVWDEGDLALNPGRPRTPPKTRPNGRLVWGTACIHACVSRCERAALVQRGL